MLLLPRIDAPDVFWGRLRPSAVHTSVLIAALLFVSAAGGYCCCEEPLITLTAGPNNEIVCKNETIALSASATDKDVTGTNPCTYFTAACTDFDWSGGGTPPSGSGSSFSTKWDTVGVKTVTVTADDTGLGSPVDDDEVTKYLYVHVVEVTMTKPIAGDKFTFDGTNPNGVCEIRCEATINPDNQYTSAWANNNVSWSISPGVGGSTALWISDVNGSGSNKGLGVTLRYTGLPSNNSSFGDNTVTMSCKCASEGSDIKVFYMEEEANHPGGGTPNWYYYWSQTSAHYGTHNYDSVGAGSGYTNFINGAWRSYICSEANEAAAAGTWNNAEGIDFFANMCRHEERHRQDFSSLWGANNDRTQAGDPDVDWLPTNNGSVTENSLGTPYHAGGYDPNVTASVPDDLNYGVGFKDCEDYALHRQAAWNNGSANNLDWANPGHQY